MLNKNKAKKIIEKSEIPDDEGIAKSLQYASSSKVNRMDVIRQDPSGKDGQICAAIEIQRIYRGYSTRCRLFYVVHPVLSGTALYGGSKHELTRLEDFKVPSQPEMRERLNTQYERFLRLKKQKMKAAGLSEEDTDSDDIPTFEEFCISCIQDWWQQRKLFSKRNSNFSAKSSIIIPLPSRIKVIPWTPERAVRILQRTWRKHVDMQVFRYYKDLINFRQRGDPAMMLRCINPIEAKLLDPAAGIHVKFRLAGIRFPPSIYYKIFTHRPVQDLCANSPKDYTGPEAKRKVARDVHNKGNRVPETDKDKWYKRWENNGWRMVSDRLLHHMMSDPVTWESSQKKVEFHHNKLQRRQDLEKKKKQKKILWMRKMYKEGMLKAKTDDEETEQLVDGATKGMIATVERHGTQAVQEWEVDELLEWTTGLNFEDYLTGWKEFATSANSEKPVGDRLNFTSTGKDPYEFSITAARRDGSLATIQSHNTPVSSQSLATLPGF